MRFNTLNMFFLVNILFCYLFVLRPNREFILSPDWLTCFLWWRSNTRLRLLYWRAPQEVMSAQSPATVRRHVMNEWMNEAADVLSVLFLSLIFFTV